MSQCFRTPLLRNCVLVGSLLTIMAATSPVDGQNNGNSPHTPWCRLPDHPPKPPLPANAVALIGVGEVENNDTPASAQLLPFGDGAGEDRDLDINGSLSTNSDVDYFRLSVTKGDVLGIAVLGGGAPDSIVAITTTSGTEINTNDDHGNVASYYPPNSPLPGGINVRDSVLSYVVPSDGDLLIRVTSWNASSSGSYTLQVRGPRPYLSQQSPGTTQTIFLDFDGASVNANALFGLGNSNANLSPLSSFLGGWGFSSGDESAVIDAVIAAVEENLDDLRDPALNGDRDSDGINGHFDYVVLNSRDHADPFGQPNVSRLIFGGTINQLGISTIGIAQYIDPGNFGTESTAVILLDLLSAGASNPNSINSIPLSGSISKIDAVGLIVGAIGAHEAGHFLGNWHTVETNSVRSIMDQGGNIADNIAGVGSDNTLGTADDQDVDLSVDTYLGGVATGLERTNVRTAFALSTGGGSTGCMSDGECDDGNVCNGSETCVGGSCQAGVSLDCNDGDACTDDTCDALSGCQNDPIVCNDGNSCTSDSCNSSTGCVFAPIAPCCGNGTCELGETCVSCSADCFSGSGTACGNGICEPGEDCLNCAEDCNGRQNGNPNNRFCCSGTSGGLGGQNPVDCGDSRCTSSGYDCSESAGAGSCCGDGSCEGSEDENNCTVDCACTGPGDCDDNDGCTDDDCVGGICINDPIDCSDGDACTNDGCSGGACTNDPVNCDDGDACTADSCDSQTGCENSPITTCQDGDGCCPSGCTANDDDDCTGGGCLERNESCTADMQCCSGICRGNGRCR